MHRKTYHLTLLLFLLSGAFGLGYQVLWSRYLLDFIGVSAYSYAIVLAAFMGGLALGSYLFGRLADRMKKPLRLYALLELGIGLYAAGYLPLMRAVESLYGQLVVFTPQQAGMHLGLWAKALCAGLLLLPPTVLMGGTYPALVRQVTPALRSLGRRASQLYAVNAFGAVCGILLAAFLWMPALGMRRCLLQLALCNVAVAGAAWLLAARISPLASPTTPAASPAPGTAPPRSVTGGVGLGLLLIFVEGALAFHLELGWTRYFAVVLGSSTYSFSIMLAAFITGIALGSAWLARLDPKLSNPLRFFGFTQLAAAALILLPIPLYPYVPWLFREYGNLFAANPNAFVFYEGGKLLFCFAVMLPPTLFIGMALPLMVKWAGRRLAQLGLQTGRVYACNTLGNVLGALLAGVLLLSTLGMERLLRFSALGGVVVGVLALLASSPRRDLLRPTRASVAIVVGLLLFGFHLAVPAWNARWFLLVPFRRTLLPLSLGEAGELLRTREVCFFEDDPASHLMVVRHPHKTVLYINGKGDASSVEDMPTQMMIAHAPLMLHPDPQEVLVIGLASGVTAGEALKHEVKRVDVVELARKMPEATQFFSAVNSDPMADPRCRLIFDDARSYLSHTREQYDVILSEPSNPWIAGIGSLFSREFYERARRALRPEGLFLQWLQLYEMSDETFAACVRTFRMTFPSVYGFQGGKDDLLLIGSLRPLRPDWSVLQRRLQRPALRESLARLHIEDRSSFLFLQRLSPPTLDYVAALGEAENTDDNHYLEYQGPRDLFLRQNVQLVDRLDERLTPSGALFWSRYLQQCRPKLRPLSILRILNDDRMRVDRAAGCFRIVFFEPSHGGSPGSEVPGDLIELFPASFRTQPPPAETELRRRLGRLIELGRQGEAGSLLSEYASPELIAAVLWKDRAAAWLGELEGWLEAASDSGCVSILRMFRVDLLLASGQDEAAGAHLRSWLASGEPVPEEWAVLRAMRRGDPTLEKEVLDLYRRSGTSDVMDRLLELRWDGNTSSP